MNNNQYLRQFMDELESKRAALAKQPRRDEARPQPSKLDYVGTLRRWWNSLAPATRQHPWSLETIAAVAFTDPTKRPAMRLVAAALRELNFVEKRDWTKRGRNRRHWLPPTND